MELRAITQRAQELLASLPPHVTLLAAGKTRTPEELQAAIEGGVRLIGHNYVQEAQKSMAGLGERSRSAQWHLIGHLQSNKAQKAAQQFDLIQTVDSFKLGKALHRAGVDLNKEIHGFVEINIANEPNKSGVAPDNVAPLLEQLSQLTRLRILGLMTMGPLSATPEELRPYFKKARELFDRLSGMQLPQIEMKHLSMGMSDSFRVAIEEGATMVRVGSSLFGPR